MNEEYADYLKSTHWMIVRNERLAIDNYKCKFCGSMRNLQVHHLYYDTLWNEKPEEALVTLCEDCHKKLHALSSKENKTLNEVFDSWANEVHETLKPLTQKYSDIVGEIFANITYELIGDSKNQNISQILKIVGETANQKVRQRLTIKNAPYSYESSAKALSKLRKQGGKK